MPNTIRVAVVQAGTVSFSLTDTLAKLEHFVAEAKEKGVQLAVFPEGFIGGYPKFSSFGTRVGGRSSAGRDEWLRYHNAAIAVPGPAITQLEAISKESGVFLVVGIIEKDGGSLYCSAVFIDPKEGYVTKHRKIVPTGMERVVWGNGTGEHLPVPEATFKIQEDADQSVKAKLSVTICWENYMPLLRTFYYSKGVQIYCAPTVDDRETWQPTMKHIALEGRCFVLGATQFTKEKDYPPDHEARDASQRNPENIVIAGGSVIVSPFGEVLAGPLRGQEGILTADIDLDEVIRGKMDLDVVGHYSRPDIFQLKSFGTP